MAVWARGFVSDRVRPRVGRTRFVRFRETGSASRSGPHPSFRDLDSGVDGARGSLTFPTCVLTRVSRGVTVLSLLSYSLPFPSISFHSLFPLAIYPSLFPSHSFLFPIAISLSLSLSIPIEIPIPFSSVRESSADPAELSARTGTCSKARDHGTRLTTMTPLRPTSPSRSSGPGAATSSTRLPGSCRRGRGST